MSVKALFGSSAAIDETPDQFTFTDTSGVNPSSVTTSGTVTVTGLSPGIPITVTASGGTLDAGTSSLSGTYASSKSVTTSASGTFVMAARATSSASFSTAVNVTVTVNGVSDVYTVTTRAADTIPIAFTFTNVTSAERNTVYSASVVPIGYDNASWSVTGGEGSTNNSTWSTAGSITSGQTFYIRRTSSSSYSTGVSATANIGGTTSTFSITTRAVDTTPNAFSFTPVTDATRNIGYSRYVTVTGLDPNVTVTVSVTGGSFNNYYQDDPETNRIGSYSYSAESDGTITLRVSLQSGVLYSTTTTCNLTVNGVTGSLRVTTAAPDISPNGFTFTDRTVNYFAAGAQTSNTITVSGMSPGVSITVSASGSTGASVNAGTSSLSGTFSVSKTVTTSASGTIVVAARVNTTTARITAFNCVVNISSVVDTFTCTTN